MDELQKLSLQLADVDRRFALQADYEKTLLLLAAVKANKVFIDEFELVPGGWRLIPPPAPAPGPAQVPEPMVGMHLDLENPEADQFTIEVQGLNHG